MQSPPFPPLASQLKIRIFWREWQRETQPCAPTSLQPTVSTLSYDNPTIITHASINPHNCALHHCNYKASQLTGYSFLVHGSTKLPPCPLSQHRRRDHWLAGRTLGPVFLVCSTYPAPHTSGPLFQSLIRHAAVSGSNRHVWRTHGFLGCGPGCARRRSRVHGELRSAVRGPPLNNEQFFGFDFDKR